MPPHSGRDVLEIQILLHHPPVLAVHPVVPLGREALVRRAHDHLTPARALVVRRSLHVHRLALAVQVRRIAPSRIVLRADALTLLRPALGLPLAGARLYTHPGQRNQQPVVALAELQDLRLVAALAFGRLPFLPLPARALDPDLAPAAPREPVELAH